MQIIFLDIDGVMNSHQWLEQQPPFSLREHPERAIDPAAVQHLNHLTDKTGAQIVVTSTWRLKWSVHRLRKIFVNSDIRGALLDVTEVLTVAASMHHKMHVDPRAQEIFNWLQHHPEVTQYVVLDDLLNLGELRDRHVIVDAAIGLTHKNISEALEILEPFQK